MRNFADFSFFGLSHPTKRMTCPVGRYVTSMGDRPKSNRRATPSTSHAQPICSYTDVRSVLPTLRSTTALASGLSMISSTMAMEMNDDLVELRPPLNQ